MDVAKINKNSAVFGKKYDLRNEFKSQIKNEIKIKKETKEDIYFKIEGEYDSKRNFFDPVKGSPNVFLNNLQNRMKQYYNVLSKKYK